jgi:Gpi18-like mannosyltransferase
MRRAMMHHGDENSDGGVDTRSAPPAFLRWMRLAWASPDTETAIFVLILKGLVLGVAVLSIGTLFDQKETWQTLWTRWDATHYLNLARDGYVAKGEGRFSIAFYPLYPWLVRAAYFVCRNYFVAALLVSAVASVFAGILFRRLVELDQSAKIARLAVWFLFIFPTAYFLHIGYTESLFLTLVLGSLLAARRQFWALAGVLGMLACMTRVNGLVLGPTLLVEAWLQYREKRKIDWRWLWIGAVGLGFLVYLWINYHVTGDPFTFTRIMEKHWYKKLTFPWYGIYDVWRRIPHFNLTEGLHEFIFIVFSFLCTVWCWIKLRPSYAVWMTLNWLLITSTTYVVSVPRYCLTLFPVFIIFARLAAARPLAGRLLTAVSLLLLALFAAKFAHGTWAF